MFRPGVAYDLDDPEAVIVHTEPRNKGRFYGNQEACCELCTGGRRSGLDDLLGGLDAPAPVCPLCLRPIPALHLS